MITAYLALAGTVLLIIVAVSIILAAVIKSDFDDNI